MTRWLASEDPRAIRLRGPEPVHFRAASDAGPSALVVTLNGSELTDDRAKDVLALVRESDLRSDGLAVTASFDTTLSPSPPELAAWIVDVLGVMARPPAVSISMGTLLKDGRP